MFVTLVSFRMTVAETERPLESGERVITLHDDGARQGFYTTAKTLGEALKQANIRVDPKDRTEPSLDQKLVAGSYDVNIYRARPVVIRDGGSETKVISAYRTGEQIAKHAGITLQSEDLTSLNPSRDIVTEGAAEVLTIDRAMPFTFVFYGKSMQAYTQGMTIGEMIKQRNIKLAPQDTIEPALDTVITSGMTVKLWRNGKQTMTQDELVRFETEQIKDANREPGYKEVKTPGEDGKKTVTYEIVMQNGIETSRRAINETVTKPAVKQVEIIGAKLPTPTNPSENAQLGHQMMLAYGFGEDQWPCLYNLWMRESGWKTTAANPSGAYGIPQALPGSKMGAGWQSDAVVQIQWGLGYIKGRYSTPCGAWSAFQSKGWY